MQASELISSSLISLHPDDDGEKALSLMEEMRVNHLAGLYSKLFLHYLAEASPSLDALSVHSQTA